MAVSTTSDANSQALDSEPVRLAFQLGELVVPLADLASLETGYVFSLRAPLDWPVVILANGEKFGVGELVEIDGSLAVRLCEGGGDGP